MTGRTSYTEVTDASDFDGPGQITDVYEHFDPLVGETRALISQLPASGNWVGRTIWVQEDETLRVWRASGWKMLVEPPVLADITNFGTGWTATNAGTHKPRVRRVGSQVFLYGAVTKGSAGDGSNLLTVPAAFQPPSAATRFIGPTVPNNSSYGDLVLSAGVVQTASGYGTITMPAGTVVPLIASWWLD